MGSAIRYTRFDPRTNPELVPAVVTCYREIFAAPPWSEWKKCPVCQKYWGTEKVTELEELNYRHCDNPLVDFWPEDQVIQDLHHEITGNASCWIAMEEELVIGFCWGYETNPEHLAAKLDRPDLASEIRAAFGDIERIAYQDEIGVVYPRRRQGIAKAMSNLRFHDFVAQGLEVGIARTRRNPASETYTWYERQGYKIISGDDQHNRVVQAVLLSSLPRNS